MSALIEQIIKPRETDIAVWQDTPFTLPNDEEDYIPLPGD